MSQLNIVQLIKKDDSDYNLKPVVLIYGYENLLKKQFIEKFKNKNPDFHFFWGDELSFSDLKSVFSSGALFSKGNEVVIWDIETFISNLKKEEKEDFLSLLKNITLPDRIFLVSLKEKLPSKEPFKSILSIATVINSPKLTKKAFEISVYKKIKSSGKEISQEDLKYLLSKLPLDLYIAKYEIEKLILYTQEKDIIDKKDIDEIISVKPEENIFSFINLFFKKDSNCINVLKTLFIQQLHPFEIQSVILTYANRLLVLKSMQENKVPLSEIFAKLGITQNFQQTTMINLSKNISKDDLIWLIKRLYHLEFSQKVLYEDVYNSLENLVLEFCNR